MEGAGSRDGRPDQPSALLRFAEMLESKARIQMAASRSSLVFPFVLGYALSPLAGALAVNATSSDFAPLLGLGAALLNAGLWFYFTALLSDWGEVWSRQIQGHYAKQLRQSDYLLLALMDGVPEQYAHRNMFMAPGAGRPGAAAKLQFSSQMLMLSERLHSWMATDRRPLLPGRLRLLWALSRGLSLAGPLLLAVSYVLRARLSVALPFACAFLWLLAVCTTGMFVHSRRSGAKRGVAQMLRMSDEEVAQAP